MMAPSYASPIPSGFQTLILLGPGISLNTFTSSGFPKCLLPVANRPMVWYTLDWCYRMGITNITLITPPDNKPQLEAALSTDPHLTSLPSPSPDLLAPVDLTLTTGTAELLRLPEVQSCIKSDFLLLPCDLICELPGESILDAWQVSQSALGGSTLRSWDTNGPRTLGMGGEAGGRRGGLAVFYQTKDREESVKEVPDFVATAPLEQDEAPIVSHPPDGPAALRYNLRKLVLSMPMDTLKERMEEQKGFLVRHALVKRHAQVKMLTGYRDAHIYAFPYWVKQFSSLNERFESVSEDLVGWWAKAEWQTGLGQKLRLDEIFKKPNASHEDDDLAIEEEIDLRAMSTTKTSCKDSPKTQFASRIQHSDAESTELTIPPILAYIHSSIPSAPLVRRVDSSALLLSLSLRLAKLESVEEAGRAASPFAHNQKIAYPAGVAQRCTVTKTDCLLDRDVTVAEKCVVKESVIGANCQIASGARLTRCLVMDGAVIGERCQLTGCIIGRRSQIGRESNLKDCEVQDGNIVPEETEAKNEKFMVFEGLDEDEDGIDSDDVGG